MTDPTADAPTSTFLDSLGSRGRRRAEPRTSIAVAAAGCALAVLGVLIVSGDTGFSDEGDLNKLPGVLLSALVVAAGFFTLASARRGPMATAGTVAATLGVPPLMFFLTFDDSSLPPYSTEGILVVSTLVWLGAYAIGPGRGRPFFLGAGLIGLWFTLLQLVEDVFDFPFGPLAFFGSLTFETSFESSGSFGDDFGSDFGPSPFEPSPFDVPDITTLGLISLALGVGYLLVTRYLDRRDAHGVATPFAAATLPTLIVGTLLMIDELEQAGSGLLMLLVGAGLAYHGSTTGRRATAWIGGAGTALGAAVFLSDMTDDATIGGMLFIAAGIGLVAAGHALMSALDERDEMEVTFAAPQPVAAAAGAPTYAPGWAPPPGADVPPPPGHWNQPPPAPPADIPPPPGAPGAPDPDDSEWAPPEDSSES